MRLLEGEAVQYRGVVYLVKGYQHPEGFLVAYPRYNLLTRRPLQHMSAYYTVEYEYWDCVKHYVPLVPLSEALPVRAKLDERVLATVEILAHLLDVSSEQVYVSGSALVSDSYGDVDVVVYNVSEDSVERVKRLVEVGVFKRSAHLLVSEYVRKHGSQLALREYLVLKKNTILHFTLHGVHVNLKLVRLERGYQGCVDPVYEYSYYTGPVEVSRPETPHTLPARYSAKWRGGEVVVESLRELYAELTPGVYYAENARLEVRSSGLYLVPDHGVLKPVRVSESE